jgi:hypothetical protein
MPLMFNVIPNTFTSREYKMFMWTGLSIKSEVLYVHGYTWCDYVHDGVVYLCHLGKHSLDWHELHAFDVLPYTFTLSKYKEYIFEYH